MSDFNLGQFLNKVVDYSLTQMRRTTPDAPSKGANANESFGAKLNPNAAPRFQGSTPSQSLVMNSLNVQPRSLRNMEMNHLESLDRALYVKDLMNLPKNLSELLGTLQKQIQSNVFANSANLLKATIDLSQLSALLQQNGKEAVSKLIASMAEASKQGITDLSQIKDTMKLINASVSVAGENNTQALKTLMLLYLPWLPLQEGSDFELEIETHENESGESESSLTILISTKNYGNIRVTLVLVGANSVSVFINCSDTFPKDELLKKIKEESNTHSMQTTISFEQQKMKQDENAPLSAKISMANTTQINPFLLLMAHAIIRHTIEIDRNT